jgi:hypothetical protein
MIRRLGTAIVVAATLLVWGNSSTSAAVSPPITTVTFAGALSSGSYSGCCLGGGGGNFSMSSNLCASATGLCVVAAAGTMVFAPVCATGSLSVSAGGITVPGVPGMPSTTYSSLSLNVTMAGGAGVVVSGSAVNGTSGATASISGSFNWLPQLSPPLCVGQTEITGTLTIEG